MMDKPSLMVEDKWADQGTVWLEQRKKKLCHSVSVKSKEVMDRQRYRQQAVNKKPDTWRTENSF